MNPIIYNFAIINARAPTCSNFRPGFEDRRIPGNMPFGYVVRLVREGKVDLSGLDMLEFMTIVEYGEYGYFWTQGDQPETLALHCFRSFYRVPGDEYIHIGGNNERVIGVISYTDFANLPSIGL